MKNILLGLSIVIIFCCFSLNERKYSVLIYSKTAGFHHESIAAGIKAIQQLGIENNFAVDSTTDSTYFAYRNLKKYDAIIFLNTTQKVLDDNGKEAFQKYIRAGGGFVGIHAASDTEYDWPWYNKLVGAQFKSHPKQQEAALYTVDSTFIASKHLPAKWKLFDEWYNFKSIQIDSSYHVLITIDESSYTGGENGNFHPISWYHDFEGGRSFYTALGHSNAAYTDPLFLQHILGGINYAMGRKP